ncbi:MAG: alpha/beta hydrolase [Lachnospiraceae bacterium]|nr:alpha/beta hydrolase [Lachnospiraceae bacterium]
MIKDTELISLEEGFRRAMTSEVEPWLYSHMEKGTFQSFDKKTIAYRIYSAVNPKANIMLVHGFSEFMEKYNEMAFVLTQNGFNVYAIDLRGHGDSFRYTEDPSKVHVGFFSEYVRDLKEFYKLKFGGSVLPNYMLGHSMGGAISILYAEKYPHDFDKYVFSSPMVRMNPGKFPFAMVLFISCLAATIGSSWGLEGVYAAGQHPFDPTSRLDQSSCCSPERYEYIMDMRRSNKRNQTWSGTYGWVYAACISSMSLLKRRNIRKIDRPVMILGAGHDRLVDEQYMRKFVARMPGAEYRFFPDARHEIYHGLAPDRERFYTEVLSFLSK